MCNNAIAHLRGCLHIAARGRQCILIVFIPPSVCRTLMKRSLNSSVSLCYFSDRALFRFHKQDTGCLQTYQSNIRKSFCHIIAHVISNPLLPLSEENHKIVAAEPKLRWDHHYIIRSYFLGHNNAPARRQKGIMEFFFHHLSNRPFI